MIYYIQKLQKIVYELNGWSFICTDDTEIASDIDRFRAIANKKLILSGFLRDEYQLDNCPEPDLRHDIMGHIPWLVSKEYSDMYTLLAKRYLYAYRQ